MNPSGRRFDPDDTAALTGRLLSRLAPALPGARITGRPARIGNGLDTYVYAFRLAGDLPDDWLRPLILRVYTLESHGPKARREHDIQRHLAGLGFPAPRPLLLDEDSAALGRPFMVMERMPGVPLLQKMRNPLAIAPAMRQMAALHARLHRLGADACPLPREPALIDRQLTDLEHDVERFGVGSLHDALAWLRRNAARAAGGEIAILHNDFHPLNILVDERGAMSVLDWPDAALGDRHADAARTLEVFHAAPHLAPGRFERLLLRALRPHIVRWYRQSYGRHLPLDGDRLRYWQAVAVARGIAQVLVATSPAAAEAGSRDDITLSTRLLPALQARFAKLVSPP